MKPYCIAIAAALSFGLPAFAANAPHTDTDSTMMHRDDSMMRHDDDASMMNRRSEQGDVNANNPSSPNRALGRERAEERHEMKEHRELQRGQGATSAEEQHRMMRRDTRRSMDENGNVRDRSEMERHESHSEK